MRKVNFFIEFPNRNGYDCFLLGERLFNLCCLIEIRVQRREIYSQYRVKMIYLPLGLFEHVPSGLFNQIGVSTV